ncbi:MAG: murein biosynthesis integral membrane protein MurJ, partial [Myxococcota bacterium]
MSEKRQERGAIARRAGLVAAGTLTSRVLGMVRDAVIAASFSVAMTDAFWLAFTIPNALRLLLGEGAVSGAFVPVFTDVREREGLDAARAFYRRLSGVMLIVLIVVACLGVLTAPALVGLYASGFASDPELWDTTVLLTRTVFPYIALMGGAALLTGGLHAQKRFFAPAFASLWLNVALIAAALALVPVVERWGAPGVLALAIGALVGGGLQFLVQVPAYRSAGNALLPSFRIDANVRRALKLLAPLIIALGVYQLNIIASRQLASYLPRGSVTWLFYGQRLVEIPQGVFALAIGSAALPTLSELKSQGKIDEAKGVFRYGLRLSLFVAIPASVALLVLAEPSVSVILGRGAFDANSVAQTARSLVWLAAGVWAVASIRTIVPMFHALGDTRTPVIASALNLVVFFSVGLGT